VGSGSGRRYAGIVTFMWRAVKEFPSRRRREKRVDVSAVVVRNRKEPAAAMGSYIRFDENGRADQGRL